MRTRELYKKNTTYIRDISNRQTDQRYHCHREITDDGTNPLSHPSKTRVLLLRESDFLYIYPNIPDSPSSYSSKHSTYLYIFCTYMEERRISLSLQFEKHLHTLGISFWNAVLNQEARTNIFSSVSQTQTFQEKT